MIDNNLIDDQSLEIDHLKEVSLKNKSYTLRALLLLLVITILYPISMVDPDHSLLDRLMDSLIYSLLVIPFLSVFVGIFVALFPYKDLFLHQKYVRAVLLTILLLDTAFIFLLSFIGLFHFYDSMIQ
jgi:hypothetical protein